MPAPKKIKQLVQTFEQNLSEYRLTKKNPHEKERRVKSTDEAIDKLVYELYGLTEEEIAIVEQR